MQFASGFYRKETRRRTVFFEPRHDRRFYRRRPRRRESTTVVAVTHDESSRESEPEPPPRPRRRLYFGPIAILVAVGVLVSFYVRQWRANRSHRVEMRALADVESCRVRLEVTPDHILNPLERQSGVVAPWHHGFEAMEGAELSLRVYGDASCGGAIRCEIEVDGIVIARKTTQMQKEGVDSASCRASAVDTREAH